MEDAILLIIPRRQRRCQYGIGDIRCCNQPAVTKRKKFDEKLWDVCQQHADFLDRLHSNIKKHSGLLERLANE